MLGRGSRLSPSAGTKQLLGEESDRPLVHIPYTHHTSSGPRRAGKAGFPLSSAPAATTDGGSQGGGPLGGGLASPGGAAAVSVRRWPLGGRAGRVEGWPVCPHLLLLISCEKAGSGDQAQHSHLRLGSLQKHLCLGRGGVGSRAPALGHSPHAERTGVPELPKRPSLSAPVTREP